MSINIRGNTRLNHHATGTEINIESANNLDTWRDMVGQRFRVTEINTKSTSGLDIWNSGTG